MYYHKTEDLPFPNDKVRYSYLHYITFSYLIYLSICNFLHIFFVKCVVSEAKSDVIKWNARLCIFISDLSY